MSEQTSTLKLWLGLLRPRTLTSGLSAVLVAIFYALGQGSVDALRCVLLVLVAMVAQIASNIANDLIDYRKGRDTEMRQGPLRPLGKGLLTERSVLIALALSIFLLLVLGGWVVYLSSPWLLVVAVAVVGGIFLYSGTRFALSTHALGEVAVLIFFGIVPTVTSYYVLRGTIVDATLWHLAFAIGFSSVNILVVNNYRDYAEDQKVGKRTLLVVMGRDLAPRLYLSMGLLSFGLLYPLYSPWGMIAVMGYMLCFTKVYRGFVRTEGVELNRYLGLTARNTLFLSLLVGILILLY